MPLTTTEIEKNIAVDAIASKFASLLALADAEEVALLDAALSQVMPALPNEYINFKIGWMHTENNNVECGIALFIRPVAPSKSPKNTVEKIACIVSRANEEDTTLLAMALDTIIACKPIKIQINTLPVMEIITDTWGFHFSVNTQNQ